MSSIPAPKLTPVQWLICIIAAIGFAFDIYELLMLPLIVKTAIADLHPQIGTPQDWVPDGPTWSPQCSHLEHSALRVRCLCSRIFHKPVSVAVLSLLRVCRCLCGVCCGGGMAGRTVPES